MSGKIAIQLYSLRREMEKDPVDTLKKLREIGYTCVEAAGLYGYSADYIKGVCDALGIEIVSDHIHYPGLADERDEMIQTLKTLGCKYVAVPWLGEDELPGGKSFDSFVKFFTEAGRDLKENGIQLLFHNHANEFKKVNGDFALDVLYNSVDPEYLKAQIDIGWATYKGVDALPLIRRYRGRLPIIHLKDFVYGETENPDDKAPMVSCPVGSGELDLENIIKEALDGGCEIFVVEEDEPYGGKDSFACAAISLANLKKALNLE